MRIAELHLSAFGPFTDRVLSLGGPSEPGLCVIYGENEAGKSSALRAIRGFLYGIPQKSADNFVHPHPDLRVGARVCFDDGLSALLVRRKGTKQTLTGQDEFATAAIASLEALTRGVPESVFAHFYGLDHPSLVEGSRALLDDRGELGRALFGAGIGIVHLRRLIERLAGDAEALFLPRGKLQRINAAVAEWKALQDEIRDRALAPSRFEAQSKHVADLEARVAALEGSLEATRAELSRYQRSKEACQALARAEEERRDALARIVREAEREKALVLSPQILAALEPIEALHQELGAYRDTLDQLPRREEAVAGLEAEIAALTTALGPDWGSAADPVLRRIAARARQVRERVAEGARFEDRLEKALELECEARSALARLEPRVGESESESESVVLDPTPLLRSLDRAKKVGPIDAEIEEKMRQASAIAAESARAEGRLALAGVDAAGLELLAIPSVELIGRHARRFSEQAEQGARLRERRQRIDDERLAANEALGRLRGEGSLPSEAELEAERRARDGLWRSLRDRGRDPYGRPGARDDETERALEIRFEGHVRAADELADRLRNEADRVARGAALVAQAARIEAARADLEREEHLHAEAGRGLEADWRAIWPAVLGEPGAPDARIEWREQVDALFALRARARDLELQLDRARESRREAAGAIRGVLALDPPAASLEQERIDAWIERGEDELARRTAARAAQQTRIQAFEQAREHLERVVQGREQAAAQLERWRADWAAELAASALPANTRPREAEAQLDPLQRLVERRDKREEARLRVAKMRADAERFEGACRDVVLRCLPEIEPFAAKEAVLRLKSELDRAREQATRADALRTALGEARDQLASAERRVEACRAELRGLVVRPDGPDMGEADAALDVDHLSARIGTLEDRLAQQNDERGTLLGELRLQRAELEAMDGNARQAELAEQAEAQRAQALDDVRRYAELTIARQVLEQEIDAYRRANQGPLLERAGRLFGELTRGAYPTVLSDAGDDGRPRLVALNADRREVPVEALSNGTRDQLFFALRLATLAASLERSETMPLVADDILIEFDDERTRATLDVLARFGERTQILLFSHHRHVADQARALGDRARVVEL